MGRYKYYTSIDSCIKAYLDEESETGRNSHMNVFFEGNVIYSFGKHYPLAIRLPAGNYVVNNGEYSTSTNGHRYSLVGRMGDFYWTELPFIALAAVLGVNYTSDRFVERVRQIELLDIRHNRYIRHNQQTEACLFRDGNTLYLSWVDETGLYGMYTLVKLQGDIHDIRSISDAFEFMKPYEVRVAETYLDNVIRQGNFYFVEKNVLAKDLDFLAGSGSIPQRNYVIADRGKSFERVGGHKHIATRGIKVGKRQFVSGTVRHGFKQYRMAKLYESSEVKVSKRKWHEVFEGWEPIMYRVLL